MQQKRKQAVPTLDAKRQVLVWLEKGVKQSLLKQEFSYRKAMISHTKWSSERILGYISTMEMSCGAKKHKTLNKESFADTEKATYLWLLQECSRGTPISGSILVNKALQYFCWLHGDVSPDVVYFINYSKT